MYQFMENVEVDLNEHGVPAPIWNIPSGTEFLPFLATQPGERWHANLNRIIRIVGLVMASGILPAATCEATAKLPYGTFELVNIQLRQTGYRTWALKADYHNKSETAYIRPKFRIAVQGPATAAVFRARMTRSDLEFTIAQDGASVQSGSTGRIDFEVQTKSVRAFEVQTCSMEFLEAERTIAGPIEIAEETRRVQAQREYQARLKLLVAISEERDQQEQKREEERKSREKRRLEEQRATLEAAERSRQEKARKIREASEQAAMEQWRREREDPGDSPGSVETSAIQVFRNPYAVRNKFLWLDPSLLAHLRGTEIFLMDRAPVPELRGLQFERMISEQVALYVVKARNISTDKGILDVTVIGNIAVQLPANTTPPSLSRTWYVLGRGTVQVHNQFGAIMDLPYIQFLRYRGEVAPGR